MIPLCICTFEGEKKHLREVQSETCESLNNFLEFGLLVFNSN